MKLLTATRERQGEQDGDFCFAVEGELVLLGFVCATDEADPDGGCGCGRAFSGMSSMRATTTALVRELDITYDDLRVAVDGYLVAAGMGPDLLGTAEFAELLEETIEDTVHFARFWPAGAVVGRKLDHVQLRGLPEGYGPRPFSVRDL
ncbi:hypothetical protein E4P39_18710 [Blastococcus sp. CT_GayMR19]|uniref:DUF7715 family protein n=1 Tax=Blastococcus sp. CT_GayMR19 TaxID=2559608 RepID=UPI0010746A4E|nr:hypothetical protein [Blastococcus sp. CT_GayMR19]TFV71338.1 hypothetical protein E4P39_18710 [Blastococcus sp. CT_GayMR19]